MAASYQVEEEWSRAVFGRRTGAPAGTHEDIRRVARNHLIQVRGLRGKTAVERGWVTEAELEQIAEALAAWGDHPDAVYARPVFAAVGWA